MRVHRRGVSALVDFAVLSNTQIFLLAQNVTVADGAAVGAAGSWPETSNSRDPANANAAQRPVLRKTGATISPGGKWMVEFDGNDDWLSGTLPGAGTIPVDTTGLTIFAYYKQISLVNSSAFDHQQLFDCGVSSGVTEVAANTSTDTGRGWAADQIGTVTPTATDTYGASSTGYQLLTVEFLPPAAVGAQIKVYRNSTQIGVTETNWQFTDIRNGYGFGNTININTGWRGAMGLLQVVSAVYSAGQRAAIEASMIAYFGGTS